jgi:hypothetical protein
MKELFPTPRWPLYDRRCREWTDALKQLQGEFRRDRSGDAYMQFVVAITGAIGVWMLWATTIGPSPPHEPRSGWLLPALGGALLGMAALLGRKVIGVRYRFMNGDVSEISISGRVRWREPLVTLGMVTFPFPAPYTPQMLSLHWPTHKRSIELFPSIEAAVLDILRARKSRSQEPPERPWQCERCGEENPESFEICWKCGTGQTS